MSQRTPRWLILSAILLLATAAVGCSGRTAKPKGWAPPQSTDEIVLAAHRSDLFAYDAANFQPQWVFPSSTGDDDIKPTALYGASGIDGGVIFIPTYSDKLYAVELATGELKWASAFQAGDTLVGGVLASSGLVFFGSTDGYVYALDQETGVQEWSFKTDAEVWSKPVLDGTTLYVTSLDGHLYALESTTGDELWSFETDAGIAATPVLSEQDGLIYVGGFDGRLRAIDVSTHEQQWERAASNWFWATPLLENGVVYAASLDHSVYAMNAESGEDHWRDPFNADAEIRAAPVMAGGVLVVVDRGGNVHALDPQDGSMASETLQLGTNVDADPLVLENGQVLVVTTGGEMIRVEPTTLDIVSRVELGN